MRPRIPPRPKARPAPPRPGLAGWLSRALTRRARRADIAGFTAAMLRDIGLDPHRVDRDGRNRPFR